MKEEKIDKWQTLFLFNPKQRGHKRHFPCQMEKTQTWQSCGAIPAGVGVAGGWVGRGGSSRTNRSVQHFMKVEYFLKEERMGWWEGPLNTARSAERESCA